MVIGRTAAAALITPVNDVAAPTTCIAVASTNRHNQRTVTSIVTPPVFPFDFLLQTHMEQVFILHQPVGNTPILQRHLISQVPAERRISDELLCSFWSAGELQNGAALNNIVRLERRRLNSQSQHLTKQRPHRLHARARNLQRSPHNAMLRGRVGYFQPRHEEGSLRW